MGSASCLGHLPFLSMVSKSTLQRDTFLRFLFLKRTIVYAVVSIGEETMLLGILFVFLSTLVVKNQYQNNPP